MALTSRQRQFLTIVAEFWRANGYAPSIREVSAELGVCYCVAQRYTMALRRAGLLLFEVPRSMRLAAEAHALIASVTRRPSEPPPA